MQLFKLAPVIADVISSHCPASSARERFIRACLSLEWSEARSMIEGMLAEPWVLKGAQERRLREFLSLIPEQDGDATEPCRFAPMRAPGSVQNLFGVRTDREPICKAIIPR